MKLLIIRHAKAEEQDSARWPDDSERPLSDQGFEQFRESARVLGELLTPDVIFTSPYLRAIQAAGLLEIAAEWPEAREKDEIAAGDFSDLIAGQFRKKTDSMALVGHEPSLSRLVSELVSGNDRAAIRMRPGSAALVKLSSPKAGELQWLVPPQVFDR